MVPLLSTSLWRKLLVTVVAMMGFVLLYEVGTFDSLTVPRQGAIGPTALPTGTRHLFTATAYCKGTTTASGVSVRTGIAASDPAILPVGSVVSVTTSTEKYNGVYTVMDTGPRVQGRHLDIYMWSCYDALDFGRQQIELTVLRLGWNPEDSAPSLVDRLFRRREAARASSQRSRPAQPTPVDAAPASEAGLESLEAVPATPNDAEVPPELAPPPETPVPALLEPLAPADSASSTDPAD